MGQYCVNVDVEMMFEFIVEVYGKICILLEQISYIFVCGKVVVLLVYISNSFFVIDIGQIVLVRVVERFDIFDMVELFF